MSPVFAEDVGRIHVTRDVVECDHLGSNCFPRVMLRKRLVALGELGMWNRPTLYH